MNTTHPLILNRAASPDDGWYQIEVTGRHPVHLPEHEEIRSQVIDAIALDEIVRNFSKMTAEPNFPGVLVDADHLSHSAASPTEAYGWLKNVELRDGQLWGNIEWTDLGRHAVTNKRYKFFSTEYSAGASQLLDTAIRPLALAGLALTNRPNNRGGRPISNRATADHSPPNASAANNEDKQPQDMDTKTIAKKLGLDATADEEAILNRAGALVTIEKDHEAAKADREAETILNTHKDRVPAEGELRDSLKASLITNREQGEAVIKSLPMLAEKKPAERIHNRSQAKTPDAGKATGPGQADVAKKQTEAVSLIRNRDRCTFDQAFTRAAAEHPELFQSASRN